MTCANGSQLNTHRQSLASRRFKLTHWRYSGENCISIKVNNSVIRPLFTRLVWRINDSSRALILMKTKEDSMWYQTRIPLQEFEKNNWHPDREDFRSQELLMNFPCKYKQYLTYTDVKPHPFTSINNSASYIK